MADTKYVLVTGATGGIGTEICRQLAADGWRVGVHYASNSEKAEDLASSLADSPGGPGVALRADFREPASVIELFKQAESELGELSGYVSCAAIPGNALVQRWTDEEITETLNINLLAGIHGLHQASQRIAKDGRIVQISSGLVGRPMPTTGLMTASKSALEGLVAVMSRELGAKGITVNSVRPGATSPGMFDHHGEGERKRFARMSPFGRLGTPDDVAGVVRFLMSPQARWITGQQVTADGGAFG